MNNVVIYFIGIGTGFIIGALTALDYSDEKNESQKSKIETLALEREKLKLEIQLLKLKSE